MCEINTECIMKVFKGLQGKLLSGRIMLEITSLRTNNDVKNVESRIYVTQGRDNFVKGLDHA